MEIKAVKTYENGFITQGAAFGGEEGMDAFDSNIKYRASIQNYLIDTGDEVILVDTGFPEEMPDPEYNENMAAYNGERISDYLTAFKKLGYDVDDVTKSSSLTSTVITQVSLGNSQMLKYTSPKLMLMH